MTRTRTEINRRAAAARRIVLQRLRTEKPALYGRWLSEAYAEVDSAAADDNR